MARQQSQSRPQPQLNAVQRGWKPSKRAKEYYYTHDPTTIKSKLRFSRNVMIGCMGTLLVSPIVVVMCLSLIGIPVGLFVLGMPIGRMFIRRSLHKVYWAARDTALTVCDEEGNEVQVPWQA